MAESTSPPTTTPPPASTSATDQVAIVSADQQPTSLAETTTTPAPDEPVTGSANQESGPHSTRKPASDESAAASADQQPTSSTDTNNMAVPLRQDPVRNVKFRPGARQAYFSTGLGTRAPRKLGPNRMPVIARSDSGTEAVVQAASNWMTKYKDQCLCILPSQGWVIEDLWDAEDIHMEGRRFCEEMLKYISGASWWAAKKFAEDWVKAHPDRVNFSGDLRLGDVYDVNDPLPIVDHIFIFKELLSFPRPFLWHVAFILVLSWYALNSTNHPHFDVNLGQQIWDPPGYNKTKVVQTVLTAAKDKKSSAVDDKGPVREPAVPLSVPAQPNMRNTSQRVLSQFSQTGGHHIPLRGGDMSGSAGHYMISPNMHPQTLHNPKGNRNMGSGSYNQPPGYVENRVVSGPYQRQPSGPSMQSPQFLPAAMTIGGQPMALVPGPSMMPYAGPPMLPPHGYPVQHYPPGQMQTPPMAQAYLHQPQGPHAIGISDTTNNMQYPHSTHYPNNTGVQYADPRAPLPRRTSYQNLNTLYDPYNGANPNFRKTSGYNGGGKKGGSGNFAAQPGPARKLSGGRAPYYNANAEHAVNMPPNGSRHNDFNYRKGVQVDDINITGDSVAGCAHTWIGADNATVTELWIGDLPVDACEDEIMRLFQEAVGVSPTAVSVRHATTGSCHAFATFGSFKDVKTALTIRGHHPQLRDGAFKPSVTVPKRFFQKDVPSSQRKDSSNYGYFAQPNSSKSDDRNTRGATRMSSHDEESVIMDEDADPTAAGNKAQYSPQDARSGLSKKSAQQAESSEALQTGSPKSDKPKNQQKSPTKKGKGKNKRGTPAEKITSTEDSAKATGKLEVEVWAPVAVDTTTVVEGASANEDAIATSASEGLQDPVSAQAIETGETAEVTTPDTSTTTNEPAAISESSPVVVESPAANKLQSPAKTAPVVEPAVEEAENQEDGNTAPKDPSPAPVDDIVSDDEAKHDASFHSAQEEVQTPQPEARDEPLITPQGTTIPPSPLTKTCSQLADTSKAPVAAVEPQVSQPPLPLAEPESSKAEATLQSATADKTKTVQDAATMSTDQNAASSASGDASKAMPTEPSRVKVAKKNDAQVQSLHPFAKKQISQTKKETEAKKKQQKKEKQEAERIAKAKAEQREKEETDRKAQAAKLAVPGDSIAASAKPATTTRTNTGQATPGSKKSKAKPKAKPLNAGTLEQDKKVDSGDDTGKPTGGTATDVSKEIDSITQKVDVVETSKVQPTNQASSTSSRDTFPKAIASPLTPEPTVTQGALAPTKKAPTQKVNPHHNHLSQNTLTYAPGSQGTGFEVDSNQSFIPPSSVAPIFQPSQHNMSPSASPSRGLSSSDTLVAGIDDTRIDSSITSAPNTAPSGPAQLDTANAGTFQTDVIQTGVSTKKKKPKSKKKKAATDTNTDTAGPASATPIPESDEDLDPNDPFASQFSQIDALRRAVKADTKDAAKPEPGPTAEQLQHIKAFVNERLAKMDKEAEEDMKNGVPSPIDEWNKNLQAYWGENPDRKPKDFKLWSKKDFEPTE